MPKSFRVHNLSKPGTKFCECCIVFRLRSRSAGSRLESTSRSVDQPRADHKKLGLSRPAAPPADVFFSRLSRSIGMYKYTDIIKHGHESETFDESESVRIRIQSTNPTNPRIWIRIQIRI